MVQLDYNVLIHVACWASDLASLLWLQEIDVKRVLQLVADRELEHLGEDGLVATEGVNAGKQKPVEYVRSKVSKLSTGLSRGDITVPL